MSAYKIQPFLSHAVNLLTVESIARQHLFPALGKTTKSTILTTVEPYSHQQYADQISKLVKNTHIKFVPYFQPLVYEHYKEGKIVFEHPEDPRGISLVVGNNNPQMLEMMDEKKIITLEELCRAFPQKIPLSFRNKDSEEHIKKLQQRIGKKLSRERVIQFEHIIMISPQVKMWDQAIQVILDFMPTPFVVPYLRHQANQKSQTYNLTVDDFLSALHKVQSTMKVVVKDHAESNIIQYTQRKQLDWMISQVAPQAKQMVIDRYFFKNEPKTMQAVEQDVKIPTELGQHI